MTQELKSIGSQIQIIDDETDEIIGFTKLEGDGVSVNRPGQRAFIIKSRQLAIELFTKLINLLSGDEDLSSA